MSSFREIFFILLCSAVMHGIIGMGNEDLDYIILHSLLSLGDVLVSKGTAVLHVCK